jgi:hypothetical protein
MAECLERMYKRASDFETVVPYFFEGNHHRLVPLWESHDFDVHHDVSIQKNERALEREIRWRRFTTILISHKDGYTRSKRKG